MSASFKAHTPMLQQYFRTKAEYPGVLLFMRVGDFFELYGEDAEIASRELELTLTGREDGPNGRVSMAGVPHHAVERYLARLVAKGIKVALCDQIEDPKTAKGLVKRKVTRVVTPGTILEDSMLDGAANNYLVACVAGNDLSGVGVVDVSTGEFLATEIHGDATIARIVQEVQRLQPAEVLVPVEANELAQAIEDTVGSTVSLYDPNDFPDRTSSRSILLNHFSTSSLRGFGCEDYTVGLDAAAMVLRYLNRNQVQALQHIRTLSTYSVESFMYLDTAARRNLELTKSLTDGTRKGTLMETLDRTRTPMGTRMMRRWLDEPLQNIDNINLRLDAVQELVANSILREDIRAILRKIGDIERLISRVAAGAASPRDYAALRSSLQALPQLNELVQSLSSHMSKSLSSDVQPLPELEQFLCKAIIDEPPATTKDGGVIREGFNAELDAIRTAQHDGRRWIAQMEATERERTGINTLKVGYNAVFGYYLEVTKANVSKVPDTYTRKQTTVNAERYITPELKELEAKVTGAEERAITLEHELYSMVRDHVAAATADVQRVAHACAAIDVLCSYADTAATFDYCRPAMLPEGAFSISGGRHPVVEQFGSGGFIPNDCLLDDSQRMIVLTGPNMAGKSTYLRQVALIALMAHIGSFVPATSAEIPLTDRIFTRVGAHDELATGQSTFMVEMTETATILNHATNRSLVILDEIGRGTSTYDGLAIAWSVAEYLLSVGCRTLFATHYHYLNELANQREGVANFRVTVRETGDRIIWLHKIMQGGTDKSYGIQVARMAGAPPEMIARAHEILHDLEKNTMNRKEVGDMMGLEPSPTTTNVSRKKLQLTLFDADRDPILDDIEQLDVSAMTPIDALVKIEEWQRKIKR